MRIKSKLIAFFSMIILVVALAACNSGQKDDKTIDDTTTTQNDSTMNDSSKVDDAYEKAIAIKTKEYDEKIDSLNREISVLQDSYSVLSDRFKAYEETSKFWNIAVIIALILSVIAVFINKTAKCSKKLEERILGSPLIRELRKECEELRSYVGGANREKSSQSYNNVISKMQQEIQDLKQGMKSIRENQPKMIEAQQNRRTNTSTEIQGDGITKEYYVGSVNDIYLMNPTPSRYEKSVFRIHETSFGKGTFDILDIDQVRQLNGLDKIIEYIPSGINIQNAEHAKTDRKGECEKEGDAWKVTKPVRIKIEKR